MQFKNCEYWSFNVAQNIHASLSLWAYIVFDDRAGKIEGLIVQWAAVSANLKW